MATEVLLAVAGSGKTMEIVERIKAQEDGVTSLAVTFTQNAQAEIVSRLQIVGATSHETMGWYAFLLRHIVRPYLPAVFPEVLPSGLNFVKSDGEIPRSRAGWKHYFDDDHRPYSTRLSVLAKKVLEATDNAPIRRLQAIYERLYIDEFQDLGGNDLVVVRALMESKIDILLAGDARQAVLQTSRSDRLHADYRGVQIVEWFRLQENGELCTIIPLTTTRRFNQQIANFSDMIHSPDLVLPATTSLMSYQTGHDGICILDEEDVDMYMSSFDVRPTQLWSQKGPRRTQQGELLTFGTAKGITRDRVVIYATGPIVDFLKRGTYLAPKSACGFYVAVTRARFSVALVVENASNVYSRLDPAFSGKLSLWVPPATQSSPNV